jgi:hypothetical protein
MHSNSVSYTLTFLFSQGAGSVAERGTSKTSVKAPIEIWVRKVARKVARVIARMVPRKPKVLEMVLPSCLPPAHQV